MQIEGLVLVQFWILPRKRSEVFKRRVPRDYVENGSMGGSFVFSATALLSLPLPGKLPSAMNMKVHTFANVGNCVQPSGGS